MAAFLLLLSLLASVTVEGASRPVQSAELGFWVQPGPPARVRLDLEVVVDGSSGEDGALAPSLSLVPKGPLPSLEALAGKVFDDRSAELQAWYGNDAPELTGNRLEFLGFPTPDTARVRWTAVYDEDRPFRFEGTVAFSGIAMRAPRRADAERLLRAAWPSLDPARLAVTVGEPVTYGERTELPVTFKPRR